MENFKILVIIQARSFLKNKQEIVEIQLTKYMKTLYQKAKIFVRNFKDLNK